MAAAAHASPNQHLFGPPAPQTPAAARRPPAWYEEACSPQACSAPAAPQPSPAGTSNTHAAPIAAPDEIRLPRPAPRPAEPCGVRCRRSSSPAHATSGLPVNRRPLRPKATRAINLHSLLNLKYIWYNSRIEVALYSPHEATPAVGEGDEVARRDGAEPRGVWKQQLVLL